MAGNSVAVVGSGAGGMAVAAAFAETGRTVTLSDAPGFSENIDAVARAGGVERRGLDADEVALIPLAAASNDIAGMTKDAELVVVVAPLLAHEVLLDEIGKGGKRLLFIGEGGGALRAVGAGRDPASVAETNTLLYLARVAGPGQIKVLGKTGGVFVASASRAATGQWLDELREVWPILEPASDVIDTLLANYNVIDHVPTVLGNAGYLESGEGTWRLWGEGCTPAVARAIEALDAELQGFRQRLGLPERRYVDQLVAQGFVGEKGKDLHSTIQSSVLSAAEVQRGPAFLQFRFIREDVPHAMVLIESVADAYGHDLPLASGLIAFTSALLGEDVRATGTSLATLGFMSREMLEEKVR